MSIVKKEDHYYHQDCADVAGIVTEQLDGDENLVDEECVICGESVDVEDEEADELDEDEGVPSAGVEES